MDNELTYNKGEEEEEEEEEGEEEEEEKRGDHDEKGQEKVKIEIQSKHDDDVDHFESLASVYDLFDQDDDDDYIAKLEGEWDVDEGEKSPSKGTIDSEKEMVQLDVERDQKEKRRSIYELASYSASVPLGAEILKLSLMDSEPEPRKDVRYSTSMGLTGIARIDLSPLTQKVIGCVIGENVSTEYPWVFVRKEIIEDNIDLHDESSDFLPVKDEIQEFPEQKMLIGYMPSLTQEGQFYICLTAEGQQAVIEYIKRQREEHENRVRNTVYKPLGEWKEFGSSEEIETNIVTKTRPLLEIEFVSTADVLNAELDLVDRTTDDQRDGYLELLPYREVFQNISRRLMCNATQVTPENRDAEAQTVISTPANRWNQYGYEYESPDISSFTEEQLEQLSNFLHRFTDEVCDEILLNATWDIYSNDYVKLVRDPRDTQWAAPAGYKEHLSFHDGTRVVEKVINDIAWHPLWTGIFFAAYTRHSKGHRLIGPMPHEDVLKTDNDNYVLVWSFNDSLTPKLILECTREVTTVATNPLDANLIVGGCANGQLSSCLLECILTLQWQFEPSSILKIVLWHIPGKIEEIETVAVNTPAQVKYKIAIRNLTTWLRKVSANYAIKPTAVSSLKESQNGAITNITWLSPYHQVDENGIITSLPEDTSMDDLSLQFVTTSTDGTIAFWDLKRQKLQKEKQRIKKKGVLKRPETLHPLSPYKYLDRIMRPHYLLIVHHPDISRKVVITTLSIFVPPFEKMRTDNVPLTKDATIRRYFKNIVKKPDYEMPPRMLVGTVEGDFGCVKWKGYDFATGRAINTEICEWSWCKKVHDGPITFSIRSRIFSDIIATIGGKIFAIWKDTLDIPLMWKKSTVGYTAVSWGRSRPTVIILARMDGSVEIWDFVIKSGEPCISQSLSGRIITGIYIHMLELDPLCVGFCDFNGTLRVFQPPTTYLKYEGSKEQWMSNFIERQMIRTENCKNWQNRWREMHSEIIKEKQRLIRQITEKRRLEQEDKARSGLTETDMTAVEIVKISKPWEMIEEARERWKTMQLKRMQQVLLEKKGLRKDELERQREPILKMREEMQRKKDRLQEALGKRDEIFGHTRSVFFPEQQPEGKRISVGPVAQLVRRKTYIETALADKILQGEVLEDAIYVDRVEEIVNHFMKTQTEMLAFLQQNPLVHTFDWRKILREGKLRRASLY